MKNFLKSTVLFACIAMLFCACSDDSTDEGVVGGGDDAAVSAPAVTEVTPGISNIFVEWEVSKNCTADQTVVTWTNIEDDTLYGSHTEEIMPNDTFYTIIRVTTDEDGVDTELAAGTYALTIMNQNSATGETSTVYEYETTVYNQDTYADLCPVVENITYDAERGEATLTWGEVHEDCVGVTITYNTSTTFAITEIATGDQTVLVDAVAEGAYSYVATFCPEGSEDLVTVNSAEDLVLGTNPESPAWVSSNAGNSRFIARWSYADGSLDNLESSIVTYTSTEDGAEAKSITIAKDDLVLNDDNEYYYEFTSVAAGEYTLGVSNVKIGGFVSEAKNTSVNLVVYDYDTFTPPTFSSIETGDEGVIITWGGVTEELKSIVVEYYDAYDDVQKNETTQDGAVITQTLLQNAKVGSTLQSVTAYMRYTNGLDMLEYPITVDNVVVPAGSLPVFSSYVVGYADDKSTITVDWTLIGAEDFEEVRVYYGLSSQSTSDYEYVKADAVTDTSYTITGLDVAEYKVYVASVLADDVYYCLEPMVITTYGYDTYKDYVTPTPTVTSANDLVTVAWSTEGVSDLYSVTYSYADGEDDDVVVMAADIATPTTFAYVYGTTLELTYTVQYQPEGGDGTVTITSQDFVATIPEQVPAAPTGLAVSEFGYDSTGAYINIAWDASSDEAVSKYYVYTSTDGAFPSTGGVEVTEAKYELSAISPLGDYTFFVKASTAAGTMSDYASVTALAYNASYFTTADLPTASVSYSKGTIAGSVTVKLSSVNEYATTATIYYGTTVVGENLDITNGPASVTFDCAEEAGTYSYSTTFAPAGGVGDPIVVSSGDLSYEIPNSDISYADGTYEIYSAMGLAAFGDIVNGTSTYLSTAILDGFDSTVSQDLGANAVLKSDIDMSDVCGDYETTWVPMATSSTPYTGTFDGGGFTISKMYISGTTQYQAMFAYVSSACTVSDFTLSNVKIYGAANTAAFVGYLDGGTVSNCHVTGGTDSTIASTGTNSGGIVGLNAAGTVVNCTSDADFDGGAQYIGGIVGRNNLGYIIDCHLLSGGSVRSTTYRLGGITGYNSGYIIGSSSAGVVGANETSTSAGGTSGGISGQDAGGYVVGCYSIGE
ncbi:MAG: DUF4998 domain-containing protein, partial [Rikenellaceae bacterium]